MRTIFAEYNPQCNSIDVYTSAGYMLRIDCWEAEKNLKTTPGSDCALNALAIDDPLEYARLYLDGNLQMWVDAVSYTHLDVYKRQSISSVSASNVNMTGRRPKNSGIIPNLRTSSVVTLESKMCIRDR